MESLNFIRDLVKQLTVDNPASFELNSSTDCIERARLVMSLLHDANIKKEDIIVYSIPEDPKILSHNFRHVWIEVKTEKLDGNGLPIVLDMDVMDDMVPRSGDITYREMKMLAKAGNSRYVLQINFSTLRNHLLGKAGYFGS